MSRPQRIAAVGFPALFMNLAGWALLLCRSRISSLVYLSTGAVLLLLFSAVLLAECNLFSRPQSNLVEFFGASARTTAVPMPRARFPNRPFAPTNMQLVISTGIFAAYCLVLMIATDRKLPALWLGVGLYLLYASALLRLGLNQWVEKDLIARSLLCFIPLTLVFCAAGVSMQLRPRWRQWAPYLYLFFPVPLVLLLSLTAYHGAIEWLGARRGYFSEGINLSLMGVGLIYFALALAGLRSRHSFIRFWGGFFMILVPLHLITPANLLFDEGYQFMDFFDDRLTVYELLSLAVCTTLIVVGTRMRQQLLTLPGLMGLAMFLFRFTHNHFDDYLGWPLAMAAVGSLTMASALTWLIVQSKRTGGGA